MPPRGGQPLVDWLGIATDIVSSHAPARGATPLAFACARAVLFQVMPPRGGQQFCKRGLFCRREVSSHAPARGATHGLHQQQR